MVGAGRAGMGGMVGMEGIDGADGPGELAAAAGAPEFVELSGPFPVPAKANWFASARCEALSDPTLRGIGNGEGACMFI